MATNYRLFDLLKAIITQITPEKELKLMAHPVGTVYISYEATSPAELFGGTWTPITGRFPYFNAGTATGGSNTHTLTIAQMPSHNHSVRIRRETNATAKGTNWMRVSSDGAWVTSSEYQTVAAGGGNSHNNMPAYQTLYAWRRTA